MFLEAKRAFRTQRNERWAASADIGGGVAGLEPRSLGSFGELTYRAGFVCSRGLGPSYMVVGLSLGKSPSHSVQSWQEMAVLSDVEAEKVGEGVIPWCQL